MEQERNVGSTLFICSILFCICYVLVFDASMYIVFKKDMAYSAKLIWKVFNGSTFKYSETINIVAVTAGVLGGWLGWIISAPPQSVIHKTGRTITKNLKEIANDIKQEGKPEGIEIAPGLHISLAREKQHFFILGETGSGKSQIILPWLQQVVSRGDKAIVYDFKGGISLKMNPAKAYLFAPWVENSTAWDIGADVLNEQDAKTFSSSIIEEDKKNKFFCQAARSILSGFIVSLQKQYGQDWGFLELSNVIKMTTAEQYDVLFKHATLAAPALAGGDENTTVANVKSNLMASVNDILSLADAWNGVGEKISIRNFLMGDPAKKVIILQGNLRYAPLTKSYVSAIISVLSSTLGDPDFKEQDNRIWLFLDEFQELGRIVGLETVLAVGRGKGVRVVAATQDFGRLLENYGNNIWNSIFANFGTKVIAKITSPESCEIISRMSGETISHRKSISTSSSNNGASNSLSVQIEKGRAIESYMLGEELGVFKYGLFKKITEFKAFIFTGNSKIGLGVWPLTVFPVFPDVVKAQKAAVWALPGFVSDITYDVDDSLSLDKEEILEKQGADSLGETVAAISTESENLDEYAFNYDDLDALDSINAGDSK